MLHFIPENLDIDKILHETPTINIERFSKDKLLYIIHLINVIPANNKDLEINDGFVPIFSQILKNVIRNYKQYLDYLIQAEIFETDKHYIVGKKSKGYRLTQQYQTDLKPVALNNSTLLISCRNSLTTMKKVEKSYGYVTKWFNHNLTIDYELAMDFIHTEKQMKLDNVILWDYDYRKKKFKNPYNQFAASYINIERIRNGEFYFYVDDSVRRSHSNLTGLRSKLRHCLTYDGEQLVSVDIKNCQPFISSLLLSPSFWNYEKQKVFSVQLFKKESFYKNLPIAAIQILLDNRFVETNRLSDYITSVTSGRFYEYFKELLANKTGQDFTTRKELKEAVFQVMFTANQYLGQADAEPKRIFKGLFPVVYKLFALIKRHEPQTLPRLLQRIESRLIIETICKRISKEERNIPLFTVHDSIITTEKNLCYVKKVMEEEIFSAIGYKPKLHIEPWLQEKLNFESDKKDSEEESEIICV